LQAFRRQALHAALLQLRHPIHGAPLHFKAALPTDFEGLLALLRISDAHAP
jgi:23S rRNA pseudouridine1911/1915/1917 synthase